MISKVFSFFFLVLASFRLFAADLIELTPNQLETMQKQQQLVVVDIRTEQEWATTGIIPQSHQLQFFDKDGQYDVEKWLLRLKLLQKNQDQPLVLVCRSGNRSEKLGQMLINDFGMKNVYHLSNGIISWMKENKTMEKYCQFNSGCK